MKKSIVYILLAMMLSALSRANAQKLSPDDTRSQAEKALMEDHKRKEDRKEKREEANEDTQKKLDKEADKPRYKRKFLFKRSKPAAQPDDNHVEKKKTKTLLNRRNKKPAA